MKIVLISIFFLISQLANTQDIANYEESIKASVANDKKQPKNSEDNKQVSQYNEKEWNKIQKQIRKNKRKYSGSKNAILTSKRILDTIYVTMPHQNSKNTHLSDL